ncbi:hypothetical protein SAMN04487897_101632 [Paenibacillus sp. yr247]|uniref:WD40/YVTN/BNR-like repeat-containing protein n=1 Tax=Paenibacillus sp. yr247 TaxID=1761880 RepID=UPI00088B5528|nr:hypothetical protein [Paenibacillus sp. yr247]SDM96215.1 hypothetical protein SAMN04487897_101632 [Paenibacillus sp. yr247]
MTVLISNKKLVVLAIFLLCAGCFYGKSSTPSPNERSSSQETRDSGFSIVSGENIRVNAQVTPMRLTPTKALSFVDELHGYGLASGIGDLPFVQTSDGGVTWQALSRLAYTTEPNAISFLDSQTGWLFTNESYGQKSELRLTSDGGQTWEVIAQDLPGLEARRETPFFRFFDRQKGLVAAKNDKDMILLRTQDGGLTWSASSRIPMPLKEEGVFTFLSSTEGWFIGPSKKDKDITILYHMTDGETWHEAGKLPSLLAPQAISFADAQKGFILLHANPQSREQTWRLLRTMDAGKTWSQHEFPNTFQPLDPNLQLSFPTSSSGWLLDTRDLWRTTDGGLSWSYLRRKPY